MESVPARNTQSISAEIISKAKEYGADLAGCAAVAELKRSPSVEAAANLGSSNTLLPCPVHHRSSCDGAITWPEGGATVVVIGVHHPARKPEMDWWYGPADPPGNRQLAAIVDMLCSWIAAQYRIEACHLPYGIKKGGIYLKDAAVLAGLGCIGRNNMVVTPEYGPRIRLRALTLDVELPVANVAHFDPCADCPGWCLHACPQQALSNTLGYLDPAMEKLPGRDGRYSRHLCRKQMKIDEYSAQEQQLEGDERPVKLIKYCRLCELSCPVGRDK